MCILFQPLNARLIFSPAICQYLSSLEKRVRGRQITQSNFSCPWQPMAFVKLSFLHSTSPLFYFILPPSYFRWESLAFIKPPPPFVTNTATLSMSNPLEQPSKVNMEPIDSLLSVCNSWGRESKHSWNNHRWGKTIGTTFHIRQEYMFREKLVFSEITKKKIKNKNPTVLAFFMHSVKIYAGITEMFK